MKNTADAKLTRRFSGQTMFLAAVVLLSVAAVTAMWWQSTHPAQAISPHKDIPFNGVRAYDYLKQLCALGPRRSGSAAMLAQQKLLIDHFQRLGGQVELQKFTAPNPKDGSPVPMANLIVRWNPQAKERIVLCGHYDTLPFPMHDPKDPHGPFVGANDNGSGVAILMELAHDMASLDLPFGVDFVLFDGEEFIFSEDDHFFRGSEYFARQYAAQRAKSAGQSKYRYRCGVLLDMVGDANLQIYQEGYSVSWPDSRSLVDEIWATARRLGVGEFITQPKYTIRDDHLALHDIAGIPACDIIDFDYPPWHTQGDTPDKCSASSLAKVGWVLREWLKTGAGQSLNPNP